MQANLHAPEIVSSQNVTLQCSTASSTQNVNLSTAGPRLFNRFILGQPAGGQAPLAQSLSVHSSTNSHPLQQNSNITNHHSSTKSSVSLQMKGSNSCTHQGSAAQGSYKAKENNSGLLVGASSLRQRNTVYVPANSNAMLLGNSNI